MIALVRTPAADCDGDKGRKDMMINTFLLFFSIFLLLFISANDDDDDDDDDIERFEYEEEEECFLVFNRIDDDDDDDWMSKRVMVCLFTRIDIILKIITIFVKLFTYNKQQNLS